MLIEELKWHDVTVNSPQVADYVLQKCTDGAVWPGFLRHDGKFECMTELGPFLDVRFWSEMPEGPKADEPELTA